jgi:hypothetical protein
MGQLVGQLLLHLHMQPLPTGLSLGPAWREQSNEKAVKVGHVLPSAHCQQRRHAEGQAQAAEGGLGAAQQAKRCMKCTCCDWVVAELGRSRHAAGRAQAPHCASAVVSD